MASGADPFKRKLSELFSKSLCISGTSSYDTFLSKNKALTIDFLFSIRSLNILKYHSAGSTAEGTATKASDVDNMMVVPHMFVIPTGEDNGKVTGHVFLFDTKRSKPGYGKLRLLKLQNTEYQLLDGYGACIHDMLDETSEGTYFSSEKFANFFVSIPGRKSDYFRNGDYFRHGPCATSEHTDIHGFISNEPGFTTESDIAHAIACTDWPEEAREWVTRERAYDWPPQDCIEKIRKQNCFVVPVGDTSSLFYALEWRISFVLSERELVWNFNDTQLHCYVSMKTILKKYLDPLAPDQLSSYNLKTIIFWLSEETGLSVWHRDNFITCLEMCLDRLRRCVEGRCLNHYFNRNANLLGHKFKESTHLELVVQRIEEIQLDIIQFVVDTLPREWKWFDLWGKCKGDRELLIEISLAEHIDLHGEYIITLEKNQALKLHRTRFNIMLQIVFQENDPVSLLRQLMASQNEPPEDVDLVITVMTQFFMDWRFGMAYMRQVSLRNDDHFQRYIDGVSLSADKVLKLISHAVNIDGMSGTLYLATAHQFFGDFRKSIDLVTTILKQHKHLIYPGWNSKYVGIRLDRDGVTKPESHIADKGTDGPKCAAFDVVFSYTDTPCVPYPVQFECALSEFDVNNDNFVVIHPCVYAYFLICMGYLRLKDNPGCKKVLTHLKDVVEETRGGIERHHALNIIGYCYVQMGNYIEGLNCFKESLRETISLKGVPNAAAYHIALMLLHYLEKGHKPSAKIYSF